MKFIGRISLFFILGLAVFAAGAYANSLYLKWFYPNSPEAQPFKAYEVESEPGEERTQETPLLAAAGDTDVITCDTRIQIEEYDLLAATSVLHEETVPGKYLGMNREEFLQSMSAYELSPPLAEQQRGFVSLEVLSFSGNNISIRKNYRLEETEEEELFYLVCENHYITVYEEDLITVYMHTDISMDGLSPELQEEIIQKKLIRGEGELYTFLESYSS